MKWENIVGWLMRILASFAHFISFGPFHSSVALNFTNPIIPRTPITRRHSRKYLFYHHANVFKAAFKFQHKFQLLQCASNFTPLLITFTNLHKLLTSDFTKRIVKSPWSMEPDRFIIPTSRRLQSNRELFGMP